ncbi:hypothetical protein [Undibacter mobilis]|uniref:Uncharacterized protein n=1 Tax=Undibacter mobilis TaxID=2292256 RepID=A0A371BD39_9BRAD|nr:hypothetical protein [Undibacter mobilis]RDV05502.1 hypothetical protein DXH78_13520 [Undibacter mobilis]
MRLLLGIILGAALTIGGAYVYDSSHAGSASNDGTLTAERPMVNWDVVGVKWRDLSEGAKQQWHRVTANIQPDKATRAN